MIKFENILAVILTFGLVLSISSPYFAYADATVNGFFPKHFVMAKVSKKLSKKKSNISRLVTQANFSIKKVDEDKKDSFAIPKNYSSLK